MTVRAAISRVVQQEDINFLLTNRIPRRWLTLFVGWLSKIEHPLDQRAGHRAVAPVLRRGSARCARHALTAVCTSASPAQLKEGARPIDPDPATVVSPSDGIVGASGKVIAG